MTSALATTTAEPAGLLRVEEAARQIAACKTVDEAKDLHDKAKALQVYYRQRQAALEAQQDAGVIQLMAARRVGELLQEQRENGERQGRGDAGRAAANRPKAQPERLVAESAPTLEQIGIERNAARRFQELARVPQEKVDRYVEAAKESEAEITTAGLLNHASRRNPHAASNVNNAEPDKNDRFTPEWWVRELKEEFGLNWDLAGHPSAPATKVFGARRCWTIDDNCLTKDWTGKRGLGNWEWDKLNIFVPFAWLKVRTGEAPIVVQPMPGNRFEQRWAREFVEPFRPDREGSGVRIHFPRGRVGYGTILDPAGEREDNAPGLPSAAVIFEGPFVRSPKVPPVGTIDEVIAEVRRFFGENMQGMEHLWRQALTLARGEMPAASRAARAVGVDGAIPADRAALARVGINAMVDEATGYQRDRSKDELRGMMRKEQARASTVSGLTVDQFKGELQQLNFSARLSWSTRSDGPRRSGDAAEVVTARCLARGCKAKDKRDGTGGEVFRVPLGGDRLIEREALKQLRAHARGHQKGGRR